MFGDPSCRREYTLATDKGVFVVSVVGAQTGAPHRVVIVTMGGG